MPLNLSAGNDAKELLTAPAIRNYPTKLFVETTSRCNLNCVMCPKQNQSRTVADGDLAPVTFEALDDLFPGIESLVLNGMGEPLLNPHLEQFIARAKKLMPAQSWIGFQSNGLLLTNQRTISLVAAGLDKICLSMDGVLPSTFSALCAGGELSGLECALSAITAAKGICSRPDLQIGVEYVVMRDNLEELPAALKWAAERGVNFAIVSHLHHYDEQIEVVESAFGRARNFARQSGLNLRLPEIMPSGKRSCNFVEQGGAFISWDGSMHPCCQLWHNCHSFANGWQHPVQPLVFGNVIEQGCLEIWNSGEFSSYREKVLRHDYPSCFSCNSSPCDLVQNDTFEQNCYANSEPCGSCICSAQVFHCLDWRAPGLIRS